jgi:hypothetical protein
MRSTPYGLILTGKRAHCLKLEPFYRLFYDRSTQLRFSDGSSAGTSGTGVPQGDPPSMPSGAASASLAACHCARGSRRRRERRTPLSVRRRCQWFTPGGGDKAILYPSIHATERLRSSTGTRQVRYPRPPRPHHTRLILRYLS